MRYSLTFLIVGLVFTGYTQTITTWNVKDVFSLDSVTRRAADFENFYSDIEPDILILQELTSGDEAVEIARKMGLNKYFVVVSNFGNDNDSRGSFEVAIISKYSLSHIKEFETIPDERIQNGGTEYKINDPEILGFVYKRGGRGFLSAYVEELDLWITAVHLKSSRGSNGIQHDGSNAQNRETVIYGYLEFVRHQSFYDPSSSFLIAGDFNVGHSDEAKNGNDISNDVDDGYDDTHSILLNGFNGDYKHRNACQSITVTTYPDFPGSPIDNVYIFGSTELSEAVLGSNTYGSDHLPVSVEVQ